MVHLLWKQSTYTASKTPLSGSFHRKPYKNWCVVVVLIVDWQSTLLASLLHEQEYCC